MRIRRAIGALFIFGSFALVACGTTRDSPNLILIVVDTLRADRLGAYGNSDELTPFLDSLADKGFVFQNAYAPSSWTYPSVASIFTSRYPTQHGVVSWTDGIHDSELTLAEVLHSRGYATAAFQANAVVGPGGGFAQGFDVYNRFDLKRDITKTADDGDSRVKADAFHERAAVLNSSASYWLAHVDKWWRPSRPFFLYVQYMEPHFPWDPLPEALRAVFDDRPLPDLAAMNSAFMVARVYPPSADSWKIIRNIYDAEVLSLDIELRRFFAELDKVGVLKDSVVVITADHGEKLGEHAMSSHGLSLYNDEIHVPLIVIPSWSDTRVNIPEVVSLVDIAPTLAELAGVRPPDSFVGHSFASILLSNEIKGNHEAGADERPLSARVPRSTGAYSSLSQHPGRDGKLSDTIRTVHRSAFISGTEKILRTSDDELLIYDLDVDPHENDPRTPGPQDLYLLELLEAAEARTEKMPSQGADHPVSPEMEERLRALGYLN